MSSNFISPKIHEDREGPWQVRPRSFFTNHFCNAYLFIGKERYAIVGSFKFFTTSNPKDGIGMPLPLLIALFCLIKREVKTVWKVDST